MELNLFPDKWNHQNQERNFFCELLYISVISPGAYDERLSCILYIRFISCFAVTDAIKSLIQCMVSV